MTAAAAATRGALPGTRSSGAAPARSARRAPRRVPRARASVPQAIAAAAMTTSSTCHARLAGQPETVAGPAPRARGRRSPTGRARSLVRGSAAAVAASAASSSSGGSIIRRMVGITHHHERERGRQHAAPPPRADASRRGRSTPRGAAPPRARERPGRPRRRARRRPRPCTAASSANAAHGRAASTRARIILRSTHRGPASIPPDWSSRASPVDSRARRPTIAPLEVVDAGARAVAHLTRPHPGRAGGARERCAVRASCSPPTPAGARPRPSWRR